MTKRLLLTAGILFAGLTQIQAQTQKGNGILGGGVRLGYSDSRFGVQTSAGNQTSFVGSLNLEIGQFVADNWLFGANVEFSRQSSRTERGVSRTLRERTTTTNAALTPFVRRYWAFGPILLYGGGGVQVSISNGFAYTSNSGPADDDVGTRTNQYTVRPAFEVGGTYFLSNRLGLKAAISNAGLPIPASAIGLGLIYWTGPNGTGATNPETTLTTTNQGNWVVEGGFSATRAVIGDAIPNSEKNKASTISIQASIGRFIAKNTLLGVGLVYTTTTQLQARATSSNTYQTYSIAPYIQRYLSNRRLTPFLRGSVLYSSNRQTNVDQKIGSLQGSLGLGLAYLISNRFIVETSLANASYQFIEYDKDNRFRTANLSAQFGSGFSLRYVIAGRK